jgi:hypothetical protein
MRGDFDMAIYKVVLNGLCQGQAIKNILWYRTGVGIDISGLTVGGTVEVANAVKTMVWPAMKNLLPPAYEMQDITAYVFDQDTFNLLYQNPTTVGVQDVGGNANAMNGPAVCAIIRLALEPTSILANGIHPPKRGYVAIGPLVDTLVLDNGEVSKAGIYGGLWDVLCAALANNVETLIPPAIFFPIRVRQDKVLGILKVVSYADVRDATLRTNSSFRRSRMPEN